MTENSSTQATDGVPTYLERGDPRACSAVTSRVSTHGSSTTPRIGAWASAPGRRTGSSSVRGSRSSGTAFRSVGGVWAGGYVVLPQLGVYEQIWRYDLKTLAKDLDAHLVCGSAAAGAFALLSRHRKTTGKKTRKERA